jgi:cell division protease FtsH
VAKLTPGTDPVHKVTIIPRGRALGLTQQLPVDDRHTYPRDYLISNLAVLLGGRAAEELALDTVTTGAGNDIERATELARKMVCEWGMSEMGPLSFGKHDEQIFLGREISQHRDYSEETARAIDKEVYRLVSEAHQKARSLIKENEETLHKLAEALLVEETLDSDAVESIVTGKPRKLKPRNAETVRANHEASSQPEEEKPEEPSSAPEADSGEKPQGE